MPDSKEFHAIHFHRVNFAILATLLCFIVEIGLCHFVHQLRTFPQRSHGDHKGVYHWDSPLDYVRPDAMLISINRTTSIILHFLMYYLVIVVFFLLLHHVIKVKAMVIMMSIMLRFSCGICQAWCLACSILLTKKSSYFSLLFYIFLIVVSFLLHRCCHVHLLIHAMWTPPSMASVSSSTTPTAPLSPHPSLHLYPTPSPLSI